MKKLLLVPVVFVIACTASVLPSGHEPDPDPAFALQPPTCLKGEYDASAVDDGGTSCVTACPDATPYFTDPCEK